MAVSRTWTVRLALEAYAAIEQDIVAFLDEAGVTGRPAFVSQLVVEEIVLNLIQHTPSASAEVATIDIRTGADGVTVVIEDTRPPFSPLDAPPLDVDAPLEDRRAGGMGLHLVRSMTDELVYERIEGRNRLTAGILAE